MVYQINRKLAEMFGLRDALVLTEIYEQLKMQAELEAPLIEGEYWYRASHKVMSARFPILSPNMARGVFTRLVTKGILRKAEHNASRFDRTASYALTEYGRALLEECYDR